jgi:hypothetical protein
MQSAGCFIDPAFPNFEDSELKVIDTKVVSPALSLVIIGIKRKSSTRLWPLTLGTPSCLTANLYAQQDVGTTHDRILLTPDYYNNVAGSDFHVFLDHVEALSEKLRTKLTRLGHDTELWKSPVRSNNGVVEGLQVKIRNVVLADKTKKAEGAIRVVVKLSCVYFSTNRSGLSFELLDVIPADRTPTAIASTPVYSVLPRPLKPPVLDITL